MDVELPEPVRARLLVLAADLLGRLEPDAVPPPLRPIARFTPPRRRRLGASAIGAALERDEDFRRALADLVEKDTPALVEAVANGDLDADDPIAAAAVACLVRPDGWAELVGEAARQWAERGPAAGDPVEVAALRAEVAELRAAARAEAARTRAAVTQAVAAADEQLASLRRELRERTREARTAERRRSELEDERDDLTRRLEALRAGQEAEIRRLRARVLDLERAAEAARRDTRSGRDLDDSRLWLLVETLTQAAGGLRRELSLPPPSIAPAETVAPDARAGDELGRRIVDDAAALDRVLALPTVHLIVDGYNVTLGGWGGSALADQRARLIGAMAAVAARASVEVTIAFDGATGPVVRPPTPRGVRVLFSQGEIADDLIRRLVAAEPPGRPLVVVTSDQAIVRDVSRAGAWTVPSRVLREMLG
jgi:hypothetical protein